ncbi:hypothetical protein FCL47_07480 [Desulfopila sp. IMCC35006]|uniref:pilus assembly protein PilP n=1 Tax=Desulfopila sp. IMCC35006 TaxID=2569542 RepID=UPI0010ACF4B9|nr:pilus assembly protein PilP [Desulfopila sp. IMCC35006]TKB27013.1 hypothetical protein FCL47_07480 [Desulfopila sp. IMCC35006]
MMCLIDHPQSTFLLSVFRRKVLCALLCSGSLVCTLAPAFATENAAATSPPVVAAGIDARFEYQLENRADPFVPFISEKAATSSVDMNEIIEDNEPLTGMQLFEPGQLTLVATLRKDAGSVAMVEDFTGKGYVLLKGTKIGRRGVVKQIDPNAVIIEETAVTRAGKELITKVVMTLKKEGEE